MNSSVLSVRVKGDYACFTRPEAKAERVSYPVITPSAARGILEAIYWHPQFSWQIREIHILNRGRSFGILRNEVNSKTPLAGKDDYFADEDRAQRHTLGLKDVDYLIFAEMNLKVGSGPDLVKCKEIFRRRVEKGQCHHRPSLGCREFAAEFEPAEHAPSPIDWTEDLGLMLWDLAFEAGKLPYWPKFFSARVEKGVLIVPPTPIGAAS